MENTKVEYCVGIGLNMLFPEYHVVYLEDETDPTPDQSLIIDLEDAC